VSGLEATLGRLAAFLEGRRIPYMVIGGFANLHWGRPRLTQDIDVTIQVEPAQVPALIAALAKEYEILVPDPAAFANESRVLPVRDRGGVRVDLILAGLAYEEEAIRRAAAFTVAGREVRVCRAEDLIVHKLVSERPRDREDVEGVILRQRGGLDRSYLDSKVRELAKGLERPEILAFYHACLARAGLPVPDAPSKD